MRERFLRRRGLIGVVVGGAVLEAALLGWLDMGSAQPMAAQVTAIPPLGVFHDLRWLFVYHSNWTTFGLGLVGVVLGRSVLTTVLVRLAWPRGMPAPSLRDGLLSSLAFNVLAVVVLSPVVTLLFGAAVVPFSWPVIAAVPVMVLLALLLNHGGIVSPWWRGLPTLRALAWLLVSFLVLTATSTAVGSLPAPAAVPIIAVAALFDAWAWFGLTATLARRTWPTWRLPVSPLAAASILLVVVVAARGGFVLATHRPDVGPDGMPSGSGVRPVLVVGGFGSACCRLADGLRTAAPELTVQQFSYRGLDATGTPLPHAAPATNAALDRLGDLLARQVTLLQERTGRPVSIVAESAGTLVTYALLARHPDIHPASTVLLSPIIDPGRVSYPLPGENGRGLAAGWQLRALIRVIGDMAPFGVSTERPLILSINEEGRRYAALAACRTDIPRLTVLPLADAVSLPVGKLPASLAVVVAFHGGLLARADVQARIRAFLDGKVQGTSRSAAAAAQLISAAAAGWRVPPLPEPVTPCSR